MHVNVLGSKVPPLKAIDGSQVTHLAVRQATLIEKLARAIAVPNVNVLGGQDIGIGVTLQDTNETNEKESMCVR